MKGGSAGLVVGLLVTVAVAALAFYSQPADAQVPTLFGAASGAALAAALATVAKDEGEDHWLILFVKSCGSCIALLASIGTLAARFGEVSYWHAFSVVLLLGVVGVAVGIFPRPQRPDAGTADRRAFDIATAVAVATIILLIAASVGLILQISS